MDELMEEIKLVGQVLNCLLALIEVYLFDISKKVFIIKSLSIWQFIFIII